MSTSLEPLTTGPPIYRPPKGRMVLGEGVIYRASDSTLHWFDCLSSPNELYILPVDPETGLPTSEARVLPLTDSISVAAFRKDKPGSYIAAYFQGVCFLDEQTGTFEVVREIIPTAERDQRRFNDGGVDAAGRFWLAEIDFSKLRFQPGKVPPEQGEAKGRLWRYDPDGSLHLMLPGGIMCGNGIAWSPDNKTMYINDSWEMKIFAFDFDLATGNISDKRTLVDMRDIDGLPDGMVPDVDGNLWVAIYQISLVIVYSPDGKCLKKIKAPAVYPTCTTWGGKNHDIIYLTSASDRRDNADPNDEGGNMFMIHPTGTTGRSKFEFAG